MKKRKTRLTRAYLVQQVATVPKMAVQRARLTPALLGLR